MNQEGENASRCWLSLFLPSHTQPEVGHSCNGRGGSLEVTAWESQLETLQAMDVGLILSKVS